MLTLNNILVLFLPAMVANMAPVFASKYNVLSWLNKPVDFGITIVGSRLLGDNKTIRGLVVGVITAGITGVLLFFITNSEPYDSLISALTYSAATGFGALVGDSVKSFFKRRIGIESGVLWIPFDQIDFVIGASVVAIYFVEISFLNLLAAIIFIGILSFFVSTIGFALHIKKNL